MIELGYVNVNKHPTKNLFIYNYTPAAQYESYWNETTLNSRGLVLDENKNIIARPFKKFKNYEEYKAEEIPNESFDVYSKLDGSLGIVFKHKGELIIATRGSFTSDQAVKAKEIFDNEYSELADKIEEGKTYLFEIIYPSNRIVVDYGGSEDLILLAIIDNATGNDLPLILEGFTVVRKHSGISDFSKLKELNIQNEEGFVIKFKSGFRMKIKFEDYVKLHRVITNTSSKVIWEYLKDGLPFEEMLEKVPDEFYDWVKETKNKLLSEYSEIESEAKTAFELLSDKLGDKKEFALEVLKNHKQISGILFNMYSNKEYSQIIWKNIEPEFTKPFSNTGTL